VRSAFQQGVPTEVPALRPLGVAEHRRWFEKDSQSQGGPTSWFIMGFEFDMTAFRKRRLSDQESPTQDWIDQTPSRRLEALEFLRRNHLGEHDATDTIQRVHRVTRETRGWVSDRRRLCRRGPWLSPLHWRHRFVEFEFGGKLLPFISYDHLIKNKSAAKRGRDLVDVEELQKRRADK